MSKLQWDRVLETTRMRGGFALLVPGAPLLLRDANGLRAALVPPLQLQDIEAILEDARPEPNEVRQFNGFRTFEIRFGSEFKFDVTLIGPRPTAVAVVFRDADYSQAQPPIEPSGARNKAWRWVSWNDVLRTCMREAVTDSLWCPGCPPLMRTASGLHAFPVAPLRVRDFMDLVQSFSKLSRPAERGDGYVWQYVTDPENAGEFRVAVFGGAEPRFLMMMRSP